MQTVESLVGHCENLSNDCYGSQRDGLDMNKNRNRRSTAWLGKKDKDGFISIRRI